MLISRDPFARTELHKVDPRKVNGACLWCGGNDSRGRVWAFESHSDGGRRARHSGWFCSVGCFRDYHE
jgi:hypothetical protein